MKLTCNRSLRALALLTGSALLVACAAPQAPADANTPLAPAESTMQALQAFPDSVPGYVRHVITLPAAADENALKIELVGGKTATVDCNVHSLDGRFEEHDVPGWGYHYWQMESSGQMRGTLMACPPGSKHEAFVRGASTFARYNSKLPVVVFVPDGMELHWRVWTAGPMRESVAR